MTRSLGLAAFRYPILSLFLQTSARSRGSQPLCRVRAGRPPRTRAHAERPVEFDILACREWQGSDDGHYSNGNSGRVLFSFPPKQRPRHAHPPQVARLAFLAQRGHRRRTANGGTEGFHHAAGVTDELLRSDGEALEDLGLGCGDGAFFVRMRGTTSPVQAISGCPLLERSMPSK